MVSAPVHGNGKDVLPATETDTRTVRHVPEEAKQSAAVAMEKDIRNVFTVMEQDMNINNR